MNSPCQKLTEFAKSRETAYKATGRLSMTRAKAVSRIRQMADYFSSQPTKNQLIAVRQCETEIKTLLPSEQSRFQTMRTKILTLIEMSHGMQHD
jgi:hypothetical protein